MARVSPWSRTGARYSSRTRPSAPASSPWADTCCTLARSPGTAPCWPAVATTAPSVSATPALPPTPRRVLPLTNRRSAASSGPSKSPDASRQAATTTSYLCGTSRTTPVRSGASPSTRRPSRPSPGSPTSTGCWRAGAARLTAACASGTRATVQRLTARTRAFRCAIWHGRATATRSSASTATRSTTDINPSLPHLLKH